jgi:dephospho-CoA kinase
MLWVGLTGGLGTGKSTVAGILRRKGHIVIDADEMAHLALRPGQETLAKVVQRFGTGLVAPDGSLDRRALGRIVFSEKTALADLEAIVHPAVKKLTLERRRQAEAEGRKIAFYDVPLLFEKSMQNDFAKVVVVTADRETQIDRAIRRDGLTRYEVERRLGNQLPLDEKVKRADFVIVNNGDLPELEEKIDQMLKALLH